MSWPSCCQRKLCAKIRFPTHPNYLDIKDRNSTRDFSVYQNEKKYKRIIFLKGIESITLYLQSDFIFSNYILLFPAEFPMRFLHRFFSGLNLTLLYAAYSEKLKKIHSLLLNSVTVCTYGISSK